MNGAESSGVDAEDMSAEDPIVYGLFFLHLFYAMLKGIFISVDGKQMPFSQVGEEHHDLMTADEYAAYFEIFQQRSA
jgi:hypothetical protein